MSFRKLKKKNRKIKINNDRKKKINTLNYLNNMEEDNSIINYNKNQDKYDNRIKNFLLKKYWIQFINGVRKLKLHLSIFKNRTIYIQEEYPEYHIPYSRNIYYFGEKYPMRDLSIMALR
jgi:hypothetical protein